MRVMALSFKCCVTLGCLIFPISLSFSLKYDNTCIICSRDLYEVIFVKILPPALSAPLLLLFFPLFCLPSNLWAENEDQQRQKWMKKLQEDCDIQNASYAKR